METRSEDDAQQEPFETHCVIEFPSGCSERLILWLIHRITSPKHAGGAELRVQPVRDVDTNKFTHLHICAPTYRLMEIGEWLEAMKPDVLRDGGLREFTVSTMSRFLHEGEDARDLFTYAEKARFVDHEINELRADSSEREEFYQSDKLRFSDGQAVITKMQRKDLIKQIYSLHGKEELKRLAAEWVTLNPLKKQPLDKVRRYFGEHLAIYFAFLGFYTEMLIPATILGVTMYFIQFFGAASMTTTAAFAVFNLLWATFFFERWKRHCNRLAYRWGVMFKSNKELELPRAQFKGAAGKNPVTGLSEPVYPALQRYMWIGVISTPITVFCLFLTILILGTYLDRQLTLNALYEQKPTLFLFFGRFAPTAVYTVCINIFKTVYKYVATWLTDKENHRLQTEYEFHLIWKLLLFNFVNSFASLFYIAFWMQDLDLLRSHLAAQLITNQLIDQFPETILPFLKVRFDKYRTRKELRKEEKKRERKGENEDPNFVTLREQAVLEGDMPEYLGTFDDYLEIFLQFGYAFLFSSAFPVAGLFALLNNLVEIRGDAFKLCNNLQRPFARRASSIGPWQLAFELMGFAAVATNLALIYVNPSVHKYFGGMHEGQLLMAFVIVEHILIFAKLGLGVILPTVPQEVQLAMAKNEYEKKLAVRETRAEETKEAHRLRRLKQ